MVTKRMTDPDGNVYEVDVDESEDDTSAPTQSYTTELQKDLEWLHKQRLEAEAKEQKNPKQKVRRLTLGKRPSNGYATPTSRG